MLDQLGRIERGDRSSGRGEFEVEGGAPIFVRYVIYPIQATGLQMTGWLLLLHDATEERALARMRDDFVGAVAINKIARFRLDPRDSRTDQEFYELIGNDEGVFGCMALLGCNDYCPKELPLQTQIAFLRRKMLAAGLSR